MARDRERRLLVVAYAFPPCGGAGVQRTAKFVRHLPENGWVPTVLTVVPSCYGVKDDSDTPEGIDVLRTFHLDPVVRFGRTPVLDAPPPGVTKSRFPRVSFLTRAVRSVARSAWTTLERTVLIPDPAVLWSPRAVAAGLLAQRRRRFDLIYATGEPYSDFLIAQALSSLTKVPFVVDMRDPWSLATYRSTSFSARRLRVERWLEERVLARCRACIFANRAMDLYAEAFPRWSEKFRYIPNGYDAADFEGVPPRSFPNFTIVHTGTFLDGYRTAEAFLTGLKQLAEAEPKLVEGLEVHFVGKIGPERDAIRRLGLGSLVRQTGYLPHRESVGYLKGADLLLLVGGSHLWEETGKVYEYLAAGRPILALVHPQGAAADLLRRYPGARIVDREDAAGARAALVDALGRGRVAPESPRPEWVDRYERRLLTGKLAEVLDGCL